MLYLECAAFHVAGGHQLLFMQGRQSGSVCIPEGDEDCHIIAGQREPLLTELEYPKHAKIAPQNMPTQSALSLHSYSGCTSTAFALRSHLEKKCTAKTVLQ